MKRLCAVLAFVSVMALGATPALAQEGLLTFVHGVPGGGPVDVYLNDTLAFEAVEELSVSESMTFEAGDYDIAVTEAGADILDAFLLGATTLLDGENQSMVAHLDADAATVLTVFNNNISELDRRGTARLMARHCAAAGPVDVEICKNRNRCMTLEGIENAGGAMEEMRPGRRLIAVIPSVDDKGGKGVAGDDEEEEGDETGPGNSNGNGNSAGQGNGNGNRPEMGDDESVASGRTVLKAHRIKIVYIVGSEEDGFSILMQTIRMHREKRDRDRER